MQVRKWVDTNNRDCLLIIKSMCYSGRQIDQYSRRERPTSSLSKKTKNRQLGRAAWRICVALSVTMEIVANLNRFRRNYALRNWR